jgi:cytochrome P450
VAEPARMPASGPAIGRNIFTTDGEFWQRSRTQVMPIFTRAHVSDLSGFEPYLDMFMNSLPSDGIAFDASSFIDSLVCR